MASTPILPLAVWASGTNQNSIPANDNALRIEALNREVISLATAAQPATPTDGDTYIIPASPTGAQWATFTAKDIAIYRGGTWYAFAPTEGLVVNVAGSEYKFDGGAWVALGGASGDVVGPAGAVADRVVTFDGTTGKLIKDGGVALSALAPLASPALTGTATAVNVTFSGLALTAASATGGAGLRVPHGAAPTSPVNGDIWTTNAGLYARINGATVGPYATSAGGATWGSITGTLSAQTDLQAALDAKGAAGIPQNSQSTAYTLVLADANKHVLHPSADTTARTMTIPANSSVAFPVGTAVTFVNQNAAGVMTIAITTDTMRLAGAGTTGSRTLAANGMATALKITSTEWIISGTGLT